MGLKARNSILAVLSVGMTLGLPGTTESQFRLPLGGAATTADSPATADAQVDTNRKLAASFARARDALGTAEFGAAIEFFQERILDKPEDYFVDQDLKSTLKAEARKVLVGLSSEQRRQYELRYGEAARQLLATAKSDQDFEVLAEVARRYFLTEPGAEAAYLLGSAHLDQGRPLQAALQFDAIEPEFRGRWEPALTLKQAIAWRNSGASEKAKAVLVEARKRSPQARFALGDRTTGWFDRDDGALAWLDQAVRVPSPRPSRGMDEEGWMLPRGSSSRNGSAADVSPLWRPLWRTATLSREEAADDDRTKKVQAELEGIRTRQQGTSFLTIPAAVPVGAVDVVPPSMPKGLEGQGSTLDVVVFRTLANIRAVHLSTGRTLWESILSDPAYERLVESDTPNVVQNGQMQPPLQTLLTQRAWRDLTAGTLSTDGTRVYSVEDVGFVSSYPQATFAFRGIPNPLTANDFNRLISIELSTGRLQWEVGGPRLGKGQELTLAGTFFLGPPLAVDGHLYILGENSGEVSLHVLDALTGTLEWSQSLGIPEGSLDLVGRRRMVGISPAMSNGILVCPTDSGIVVGVDPAARKLLWGTRYTVNTPVTRARSRVNFQMGGVAGMIGAQDDESRWIDSTPVIGDGHVVVTPRDSEEIHCLRLHDGEVIWRRARGTSLTVAAIHDGNVIVVGRNQVEAIRLKDPEKSTAGTVPQGKSAWRDPTPIPTPSGRGVRCGSRYLIPLSTGEIATLDLKTGQLVARSKSRDGAVPGNLIAVRGAIVSQTVDSVTALDGLENVEAQIAQALEQDANDAVAMALRGELRLHRGQEAEALADLRKSVEADPKSPARPILAAALLERFRHDFAGHRNLGPEIEKLIDDPQQRADYLRLTGAGLLRVGERKAAFAEYLKLAGNGQAANTLEKMSEELNVRTDRWVRARLAEIIEASTDAERAAYDEMVRATAEEILKQNEPSVFRGFLGVFGDLPLADSVRRRLSDALDPTKDSLALELLLTRMRESADAETAGYATQRLAQLYYDRERTALLPPLVVELSRRFADVKCLHGKTGATLAEEWKSDDTVLQLFAASSIWPDRKLEAKPRRPATGNIQYEFPVDVQGPRGAYDRWRFVIDNSRLGLRAKDGNGQERWTRTLDSIRDGKNSNNPLRGVQNINDTSARMCGHLFAIRVGSALAVLDGLASGATPQDLWMRDLSDGAQTRIDSFVAGGMVRQRLSDNMGRPIGSLGSITGDYLCYQTGAKLVAADPLTGDILWERRNAPRGSEVFGDRDYIFVVAPNSNQVSAFRALDGEPAGSKAIPLASNRLLMDGRRIVAWERRGGEGGELFAIDPLTGDRVWSHEFKGEARTSLIDASEIALLDPSGRFVVLGALDGSPRIDADVGRIEPLESIGVVRSADRYVLITNAPTPGAIRRNQFTGNQWSRPQTANGPVWAFDRQTGKALWAARVEGQSFDMSQPEDLPVLTFAAYSYSPQGVGAGMVGQFMTVNLIDARNGQKIFEEKFTSSLVPHRFRVSLADKTIGIDFLGTSHGFEVRPTDAPLPSANLPSTARKSAVPLDPTPQ